MACLHGPRCFAPGRIAAMASLYILLAIGVVADDKPAASPKPGAPAEKPKAISYHAAVLPILQANCQGCHQPAKAGGKLDLTVFKNALAGGESGSAAIVPGKPDDSYLLEQITPDDKGDAAMPLEKPPLSKGDIALIRRWIEEGAKDDTPPDTTPPIDAEHPPIYSGPPVITSLDWSPDGALLAVAGFHEVLVAQSRRQRPRRPAGRHVRANRIGPLLARRHEARRHRRPTRPHRAKCRFGTSPSKKLLLSVPVTNDSVFGASWSPDGKRVAFGCTDKSVRAIDAETGEQVLFQQSHDDWVLGTAFSVDGSHLVSVGRDMAAKLIEVSTQRFDRQHHLDHAWCTQRRHPERRSGIRSAMKSCSAAPTARRASTACTAPPRDRSATMRTCCGNCRRCRVACSASISRAMAA